MIKRELTLKLLASEGGTKALGANFDKKNSERPFELLQKCFSQLG